jgi:hypothetical protein
MIFVLCVLSISIFAQDSTSVALVKQGLSVAEGQWPFVAKFMAVLAIVSEVLSLIPSSVLPANGVLDAIVKWIKALAKK